jgi:hypothetical protein
MQTNEIIAALVEEINRLQQVKTLLSETKAKAASGTVPKKRNFSAAGLARIAAAQKARWAKAKKSTK